MFRIEEVVDNSEGPGVIKVLPLDKIPVDMPKSWTFNPTCMPASYKSRAEAFATFEVREDDIWIITYPKCGTTWTQEMAWMLVNDLNFEEAKSVDITERSIYFEIEGVLETNTWKNFELLNNQKSPRVIKTHLPIGLLPRDIWRKKCKIIYVTRDPKDLIVSFYHHFIGVTTHDLSIEEFAELFLLDRMFYCSYWNHVLEFWIIREQQNILFFTFEDMKKDLRAIILKTSKFLNKDYTQEQISLLTEHLSFDKMKENSTCNNQSLIRIMQVAYKKECDENTSFKFMRKGLVGEYKKELPLSYIERINARTKEMLEPYGFNLYSASI